MSAGLRQLAEAAAKSWGEERAAKSNAVYTARRKARSAFIAAANPQAIIALLDECDALRGAAELNRDRADRMTDERDVLAARVAAVEALCDKARPRVMSGGGLCSFVTVADLGEALGAAGDGDRA